MIELGDMQVVTRMGNATLSSTSEVLVSPIAYAEQAAQAQRSIKSSSTQDSSGGTGAKKVRITFLNSNYELKTEDIVPNGTSAVNTVATDIRFVEKMQVIQGSVAAGTISLYTQTAGGGSAFCAIPSATVDTMTCHHYVPAGKGGFVVGWSASVDDEANFKLRGQSRNSTENLIDEFWDLVKLTGITTPPGFLCFEHCYPMHPAFFCRPIEEKTYIRVTVAPLQATSTTIRAFLSVWESQS